MNRFSITMAALALLMLSIYGTSTEPIDVRQIINEAHLIRAENSYWDADERLYIYDTIQINADEWNFEYIPEESCKRFELIVLTKHIDYNKDTIIHYTCRILFKNPEIDVENSYSGYTWESYNASQEELAEYFALAQRKVNIR